MLKSSLRALAALALLASSTPALAQWDPFAPAPLANPNQSLLRPSDADGLPVANAWLGARGCYVACYSHEAGVYDVGEFGVHGLVRVPGAYPVSVASNFPDDRVCRPRGFERADISALRAFKELCNRNIPSCHGGCWAGGDTGGFFDRPSYRPLSAPRAVVRR